MAKLGTLFVFALLVILTNSQNLTFRNPIFGSYSADPCILKLGDFYYLTLESSGYGILTVYKSPILTNFQNAESRVILRESERFFALKSNEMLLINGDLYLIFNMRDRQDGTKFRLYSMKAHNPNDPMGDWGEPVRLLNDWDYDARSGAVMKHNDQLYFVWTRMLTNQYNLYIAPMESPTVVGNPKVLLKEPNRSWECPRGGRCINDESTFLYSKNASCLIFSASEWSYADYCLGQMSITLGMDPLIPSNWDISTDPIFWRNDEERVYGTGAAEFTVSPDGTETWMVYHAADDENGVYRTQTARLEKIEWNEDNTPRFPRPLGTNRNRPVPSGQTSV